LMPLQLRGELADLRRLSEDQLELTRDHPDAGIREWRVGARGFALMHLAFAERYDGSHARARDLLLQAVELSRSIGDVECEVLVCAALGSLGFVAGDAVLTGTGLSRCIEISERLGEFQRVCAQAQLGGHLLQSGDVDAARDTLEQAYSRSGSVLRHMAIGIAYIFAASLLAAGDTARAERVAQESLDL